MLCPSQYDSIPDADWHHTFTILVEEAMTQPTSTQDWIVMYEFSSTHVPCISFNLFQQNKWVIIGWILP